MKESALNRHNVGKILRLHFEHSLRIPNLPVEPGAGVGPVILGRAGGNAEHYRRFIIGHTDEVTELHQFRLGFVLGGELVERLADGEELIVVSFRREVNCFNVHALLISAVTRGAFAAGAVNQNATHRLGGGGKEVGAVLKFCLSVIANKSEPGLVDERGGLQSLARGFVRHPVGRQAAQFFVN